MSQPLARLCFSSQLHRLRRKRAVRLIEKWAIKTLLRTKRTKGTIYATWCGKVHGPYVSVSKSEMVVTPFFLGLENGPSAVRTTYSYIDEDEKVSKDTTGPSEVFPGYATSRVYREAWKMICQDQPPAGRRFSTKG